MTHDKPFSDIRYLVSPPLTSGGLNELFNVVWENHVASDNTGILGRSLAYICAYRAEQLVGFVNLAWDGGIHAFILDISVHPDYRRRGLGKALVEKAIEVARERVVTWLHVDYEPHLDTFYQGCGFKPTLAGLINVSRAQE